MRLAVDQLETGGLVDLARGREDVVRPKLHAPVADRAGMSDAFLHQTAADAVAAGVGLDVKEP